MLKFNMFIPAPLIKWFRERAKKEGTTVSEVVRRALQEYKFSNDWDYKADVEIFPGDKGFEQLPEIKNAKIDWGGKNARRRAAYKVKSASTRKRNEK